MPYRLREENLWMHKRQETGIPTATVADPTTTIPTETTTVPSTTSTTSTTTTTSDPPTTTTTTTTEVDDVETSSTIVSTSRNNGGSTAVVTSPTSELPTSSAYVQSVITRTYVITSNGVAYTTTSMTPTMVPNNSGNKSGGANIGAIVGGVIGGIAGLGILLLLIFWLRRRNNKDDFDQAFDPDRAQRPGRMRGSVDLSENPEMTPHPYNYQNATRPLSGDVAPPLGAGSQGYYNQPGPAPGQVYNPASVNYGSSPYPTIRPQSGVYAPGPSDGTMSDGGRTSSTGRTPYSGQASTAGVAGVGAGAALLGVPTHSQFSQTSSARSAKEREAMARSGAMHLATNSGEEEDDDHRPVVQHSDGGRLVPREEPKEVPPAYDTIPQEDLASSSRAGASGSSNPPGFGGAPGDMSLSDGMRARAEAAGPEKGTRPNIA